MALTMKISLARARAPSLSEPLSRAVRREFMFIKSARLLLDDDCACVAVRVLLLSHKFVDEPEIRLPHT